MQIGGLQKLTLIDYPGRLAAVVFLSGCNFRCPWCYSAELVLPGKIKLQPKISMEDFFNFLKERQKVLDGIVICGGEPTINEELPDFISKIKKLGYLVKLDTNGSNPKMLKRLISLPLNGSSLIDYIAMDIKAPIGVKDKYKQAIGGVKIDLDKIKKSIEIIKNSGLDYEFRMTVVPGVQTREDIIQAAKDISPAKKFYLQNFQAEKTIDPEFKKIKPYSREFLLEIQKIIPPFFEVCQIRGET